MIRINLLAVERERGKKKAGAGPIHAGQKITVACSLILVLTALFVGWRYWSIGKDSVRVDEEISAAQQETTRLHAIIQQVQEFEQRKAQLMQRVKLIQELRRGQSGPVHMLDQISRALPPMLWLTEVKQSTPAAGKGGAESGPIEVLIDGKCLSQTSVSDFVANLEASGYFKRSVEIVSTTNEALPQPPGELVRFTVKGQFAPPVAQKPAAAPQKGG